MARACLHPRIAPWLVHGAIFWRPGRQRDKSNKPGTIGGVLVDDMPALAAVLKVRIAVPSARLVYPTNFRQLIPVRHTAVHSTLIA
jgi:hypothetical protein